MVNLNSTQDAALADVARTAKLARRAQARAHEAVFAALDLGVPQTRVAEAAAFSRMTLWRLVREHDDNRSPRAARTAGGATTPESDSDAAPKP
jgi:hypothetical protein